MKIIYERNRDDRKDFEYVRQLADMQAKLKGYPGTLKGYPDSGYENFFFVPESDSVSPWADENGESLNDEEAVRKYGLENVCCFIDMVKDKYMFEMMPELIETVMTDDGYYMYFYTFKSQGLIFDMTDSTKRHARKIALADPYTELKERAEREKLSKNNKVES